MRTITPKLTGAFVALLLFATAIAAVRAQPPGDRADKKGQVHLKRVPDVVGLFWLDAETALINAGFKYKLTEQDAPDPSVVIGHVRATIPAAGTFAKVYQEIELLIPRAATRVGIGALSLSDFQRRAGFDLDEGRYEEIYRGADIVLVHHDPETFFDKNTGKPYNNGGPGLYIEPSDGAVLAKLEYITQGGLGSFYIYADCDRRLNSKFEQTRKAKIEILYSSDDETTICVLTSKHQIAVVQFRSSDGNQFHYAIFPPGPAVKAIGRVKVPGATPGAGSGQPISICEAARQARARNSPAARGLEESCRAAGAEGETPAFNLNDLAARGETVAGADPPLRRLSLDH